MTISELNKYVIHIMPPKPENEADGKKIAQALNNMLHRLGVDLPIDYRYDNYHVRICGTWYEFLPQGLAVDISHFLEDKHAE